jgi:ubiquinone/menaquinone biosynthesis C-methylase UbiE
MSTSSADAFDTVASEYDAHFTQSETGILQRKRVHHYLNTCFKNGFISESILEVNAGTGEDALLLAEHCKHLTVTDFSSKMMSICKNKLHHLAHVELKQLNAIAIGNLNQNYDLIFSNFAGLNCLDKNEMQSFIGSSKSKLNANGHLILIMLSSQSWWEKFWGFISHNKILRKRRQEQIGIDTTINGVIFKTYYYSPKTLKKFSNSGFKVMALKPIGLFIPPTFLEERVKNKKWLLKCLYLLERIFSQFKSLSNYADHYLIHLQKQ